MDVPIGAPHCLSQVPKQKVSFRHKRNDLILSTDQHANQRDMSDRSTVDGRHEISLSIAGLASFLVIWLMYSIRFPTTARPVVSVPVLSTSEQEETRVSS